MASANASMTEVNTAKTVLDLTTSILNVSNSSNPLINGAIEIGQWLGREKLNRDELADCLAKAKSLAQPNELGLVFCEEVKEGELQNPVPHLFLKQSGALGRMMVRDPWLCWVVSTTASLFQFHSDERFISDVICTFIIRHHIPPGARQDAYSFRYRPDRARIYFVINRIVSSVWWNVVNAGHATINLPNRLDNICPRGHLLPSENLGKVMHALQTGGPRLILKSQHFLTNIALWLILHHDGLLRVVVSGKTVYEQRHGVGQKEIELRISQFCPTDIPCKEDETLTYEVLEDLKGQQQTVESGTYDEASSLHHSPGVRQPLYCIPRLYTAENRATKSSIRVLVQHTAQRMVQWLLDVSLLPQVDFATFSFQAVPGEEIGGLKLTVGDVLSRIPSIVNMKWSTATKGSVVYTAIEEKYDDMDFDHGSDATSDLFDVVLEKEPELVEVLPYFPILRDLLEEVRPNCRCSRCRTHDQSLLQPGCLRRIAFQEVLYLIAHAVADGFGCEDVSGSIKSDHVVKVTTILLLELCQGKMVVWETWFSAAACIYLGCEFRHHIMDIEKENSGATYAAIQYGNLSVIARWLDITASLKIQGCFGLIQGKGTIGVLRPQVQDPNLFQFRGVEEDFAIIQTEHTEDTSSYVDRFPKTPCMPGGNLDLVPDSSDVECDLLLVSASANTYRFLLRVQSGQHSRVIDPSNAIIRLARGLKSYECQHIEQAKIRRGTVQHVSFSYSFEEVLGRWSNIEGFYGIDNSGPVVLNMNIDKISRKGKQLLSHQKDNELATEMENEPGERDSVNSATEMEQCINFSSVLTSPLQLNVALALAVNDAAILNDGTSCLVCVQEQVLAAPFPGSQRTDLNDTVTRTVINVLHPGLIKDAKGRDLKRKAIAK